MYLDVTYLGKKYKADLTLRESLFETLKQCNPNLEVVILSNETGKKFTVKIKELTLTSMVRHL